jgi:hypothetical protein
LRDDGWSSHSVYGIKLLAMADDIQSFIKENEGKLKTKTDE